MENFEKEKSLSLADVLEILRSGIVWIIVITILCTAIGGVYAFLVKKTTYTASLKAFVYTATYKDSQDKEVEISEMTSFQYGALLAPECPSVFLSNEVMTAVVKEIGEIPGTIDFNIVENSAMFTVTYTYSQYGGNVSEIKKEVAETLKAYMRESKKVIDADNEKYRYFSDKITISSEPTAESVTVATGKLKVILLAMLLGLVLSIIVVLVKHLLDDSVNSREQIELITGNQVIAVIDISHNSQEMQGANASTVGGAKHV